MNKVEIDNEYICPECGAESYDADCGECGGLGETTKGYVTCTVCDGSGISEYKECFECGNIWK